MRPAIGVFLVFFAVTILLGSTVSLWRGRLASGRGPGSASQEWGLGGRHFGAWVTWFLVGGDFYTAYTVIAVPALVYATGAYGFFALPYTVIVYPFVYAVMPRLWAVARAGGHDTAADIVRGRFGSRALELAVAVSGLLAILPYIALQLIGIRSVMEALGLPGLLPLLAAFAALAAYTWLGGLHAPAFTAVIKDMMIYIVVFAAVIVVPIHLGGYGAVFAAAPGSGTGGAMLERGQAMPYATLALSSALAAFLYPHTLTGILAARSADAIRTNAVFLPAYTILLGLIALLGLMAHAAGIETRHAAQVVPLLFARLFPGWFAGFCFAAIAVGALVPASVMAIGAANLLTRNILPGLSGSLRGMRIAGLAVKFGALACVLGLNARFAIDFQLLGGVVILQTFPALVLGLTRLRLRPGALLLGWGVGSALGLTLCFHDGLAPVHHLSLAGAGYVVSTGLLALLANLAVSFAFSLGRRAVHGNSAP